MMMKLLAAGFIAAIGSAAQAQNLVQNGDFETGDLSGWTTQIDPYTGVYRSQQWFVSPASHFDSNYEAQGIADLGYEGPLWQQIDTVPGSQYTLSFKYYVSSAFGGYTTAPEVTVGDFDSGTGQVYSDEYGVHTFSQPFTATSDNKLILDTHNLGYFSYIDDVSVTRSVSGEDAPSILELAKLSAFVNGDDENDTRFSSTDLPLTPEGEFKAQAYKNGNQIVVAIQGTELNTGEVSSFKDLLADSSFETGNPSLSLLSYTAEAVNYLTEVQGLYPDAEITLTGHSLGGAIAQMLEAVSKRVEWPRFG